MGTSTADTGVRRMNTPRVTRGYGLLEGFLARKRAAVARRLIPARCRTGRILDIGCGSHPLFLLSVDFAEKFGVDQVVGSRHEALCREKLTLRHHDLETSRTLPFPSGFFSTVTMLAVIEHLDTAGVGAFLVEVHRVLQPGGVFVLTTPAPWSDGLLRLMAGLRLVSAHELREHRHAYGAGELRQRLCRAGFTPGKVRTGYFECFLNLWACAER